MLGYTGYNALRYCFELALSNNAIYFGLQNSNMCFYGTPLTLTLYGEMRSDAECNMKCPILSGTSNFNLLCGGIYRNSVYKTGVKLSSSLIYNRSYQLLVQRISVKLV